MTRCSLRELALCEDAQQWMRDEWAFGYCPYYPPDEVEIEYAAPYVLKVVKANGTSYGGFKWSIKVGAEVRAPDYWPSSHCGDGLHGWLFGRGDFYNSCPKWLRDHPRTHVRWLVVKVSIAPAMIVHLKNKVKFSRATIEYSGDLEGAEALLKCRGIDPTIPDQYRDWRCQNGKRYK